MHAVIRGLAIQQNNVSSLRVELYNQDEIIEETHTITDFSEAQGFDGIAGRLFSARLTWVTGTIESLTYLFLRRQGHGG